ncbi:alpha/beta fold hydrolase [Microbacterium elymi]|uniref:Alpha/beta hydrolase n=1 Tax=Microbacterium elymi TaxID=2909587 RepID=A0ABY5NHF2_9MICO|nr:alpha/beta hydrolase [Microbacterium elymi]UUT34602.1 alpha/beta hydrolase [Microbacterium elymi]
MLDRLSLPAPRYVDLDGERIATYVFEPSSAEPIGDVVLCHGTPWSAAVWSPVAHHLASARRVYLYDMPGYGASISACSSDVDLVTQRRRFAAMLDHWGLSRPHVVAHDIGGAVALGAHLLEGVQMSSLYLADVVTLDPWGSPFFQLVAQHEEVFGALPASLHAALVHEYISGASNGKLDARVSARLASPWCTPEGQRAFYRQIAALKPAHTRPIVDDLARVACRVRVAWGEADPWIPVAQAAELATRIPGVADTFIIPAAGHLVPLEAAGVLGADVANWLDQGASRG